MIRSVLINPANGKALHIEDQQGSQLLVVSTENFIHGTFRSVSRVAAGTTVITAPLGNGAIALTDLVVSTDRVPNSAVTVTFTDDTETIEIFHGFGNDAPINFAISFAGRWQGWKDARVEMTTTSTISATCALGYYRVELGEQFSVWDAAR